MCSYPRLPSFLRCSTARGAGRASAGRELAAALRPSHHFRGRPSSPPRTPVPASTCSRGDSTTARVETPAIRISLPSGGGWGWGVALSAGRTRAGGSQIQRAFADGHGGSSGWMDGTADSSKQVRRPPLRAHIYIHTQTCGVCACRYVRGMYLYRRIVLHPARCVPPTRHTISLAPVHPHRDRRRRKTGCPTRGEGGWVYWA